MALEEWLCNWFMETTLEIVIEAAEYTVADPEKGICQKSHY